MLLIFGVEAMNIVITTFSCGERGVVVVEDTTNK